METKKRVFSGVRANARLHLGNYLGAIKGMLALQDTYDCIFSVVDLHTITTPFIPAKLPSQIRDVVLDYLGAGLDPAKCHLLVQSHLGAEHLELAYYFSTLYPVSRLEDLPTYKEKKLEYPNDVNLALLSYPVLMAADILLYKAPLVPIGKDQEPHLEVAREIARKFNKVYETGFPEPQSFQTTGAYVPSLTGEGKMSKSKGGTILLTDGPQEIQKALFKAPTDLGKGDIFPEKGPVANLMAFVELFEGKKQAAEYRGRYTSSGIQYAALKEQLAEAIYQEIKPVQEKRKSYENNPKLVEEILAAGAAYARTIAQETLQEVRLKMGLAVS